MTDIGLDQPVDGRGRSTELARVLRSGPFEVAFRVALRDSGLSLERIQDRLGRLGVPVSTSTLSNWQTGRSRPERPDSMRALHALERVLELPRDSLLRLLGPRRARGRWVSHIPGSVHYDMLFDDHDRLSSILSEVDHADDSRYRAVSVFDRVLLDPHRRFTAIRVQHLIRALVAGVDSCVVFFHSDDGPAPQIIAREGVRLGRHRTDQAAGISVAELLLDCSLTDGEVYLLEYEWRFGDAETTDYYCYRAFHNPCSQYLLQVQFDPAAVPVRCVGFRAPRIGVPFTDVDALSCQRGRPAHLLTTDSPAGIVGIRWEWD